MWLWTPRGFWTKREKHIDMCYLLVTSVPLVCSHLRAAFFIWLFLWSPTTRPRNAVVGDGKRSMRFGCYRVNGVYTQRAIWLNPLPPPPPPPPLLSPHSDGRCKRLSKRVSRYYRCTQTSVVRGRLLGGKRQQKNRVIRVRRSKSILYWNRRRRRRPSTTVHRVQSVRPLAAAALPPSDLDRMCLHTGRSYSRPLTSYGLPIDRSLIDFRPSRGNPVSNFVSRKDAGTFRRSKIKRKILFARNALRQLYIYTGL